MKAILSCLLLCVTHYCLHAQNEMVVKDSVNHNMRLLLPVLWQQTAAEYRALCYQAFNMAALRIEQLPKKLRRKKNVAIITDIDETILNNSYFDAQLIKDNRSYSEDFWRQWVNKSEATLVPGAAEFLQLAKQKRISVFYISNRSTASIPATLLNLQKHDLPNADTAHLLFLKDSASKETRRQSVLQKYNVVMLLGDNLNDFANLFERKNVADRLAETDRVKTDWGTKFIVLPNPTYGDWENTIYNNLRGLTREQKEAMQLQILKGFTP